MTPEPDYDLRPDDGGGRRPHVDRTPTQPFIPARKSAPPTPPPRQAAQAPEGDSTPRTRRVQGEWLPTGGPTRPQRREQRGKTVHKTRNGGGFNPSINPSLSINVKSGGGNTAGQGPGPAGSGSESARGGTPGAGFMSNEDIHAFSEHIRREGRKRATERSMDAEQLEVVLRTIPDTNGSIGGARMRARRVSRHLKRIAKAEQLIAKEGAAMYAAFEREYEADLRTVGRGRTAPPPRAKFDWR